MRSQDEVSQLCTWICHFVAFCPLESLEVSCGYAPRDTNFNDLIFLLAQQHSRTLRFLRIHQSYVEPHSMRFLCEHFVNLEELSVMMNGKALVRIYAIYFPMPHLADGLLY